MKADIWHKINVVVMDTAMLSTVNTVPSDGVSLSLNGTTIANDSYVDVNDIGHVNDSALLCHTNKSDCCRSNNVNISNWFFPNDTRVQSFEIFLGKNTSSFSRNRGDRVVRLLRARTPAERGRFYCQVPDVNGVIQTIFVNIGE